MKYRLVKNREWKDVEINGYNTEIPKTWIKSSFTQDVLVNNKNIKNQVSEINYIDISCIYNNKINYTQFIDKDIPDRAKRIVLENDTIVSTVRPNLKCFAHIEKKYNGYICSTGFCVLTPKNINNKFLYFLFKSEETTNFLIKESIGATYPSFNSSLLKTFQYKKPSIKEQVNISNILIQQESIISNIEELIKKNEVILSDLSNKLLSGELRVKEENGKIVFYKNPDDNWVELEVNQQFKNVPKDWEKSIIKNHIIDNKKSKIKAGDLNEDSGIYPAFNCSDTLKYKSNKFLVDGNNLFLSTGGHASVHFFNGKASYSTDVYSLKPKEIDAKFLYLILNSNISDIEDMFYGAGLKHLNKSEFRSYEIIKPDMKEQELIVDVVGKKIKTIKMLKILLEKEKEKFSWLLENLLSGKYLVEEVEKAE